MLGLCWAYVEACWAILGPCWAHVGPMLGLCWAHLGRMLGHVERKFGNLAEFRPLKKKTWKNTVRRILEQKCSSPKLKVNSCCNCFRIMRANKKRIGTFGAGGFWCTTYFGRNCHDFFLCEIGRHTCTTPGPSGRRDQSCSLQHP